jgi:hypothetical protein
MKRLKIKDKIDLNILIDKYGFCLDDREWYIYECEGGYIEISPVTKIIMVYSGDFDSLNDIAILYNLIENNLVEVVEYE